MKILAPVVLALSLMPAIAVAQVPPPCDSATPPPYCDEAQGVVDEVDSVLKSAEEILEDVTRSRVCEAVAQATGYPDGRIDAEGGGSCQIGDEDDVNERDVQGAVIVTGTNTGQNTCYDANGECVAVVATYQTSFGSGGQIIGCIQPVYASPFPLGACTARPYVFVVT